MQDLWGGRGRPTIPQACPLLCLYQAKPHVLQLQKSTKLLQNLKRRIPAQTSVTIIGQAEKTPNVIAPATDDTCIFQITERRLASPFCKWSDCNYGIGLDPFGNVNFNLVQHVSSHIDPQLDIAPVQRENVCQWKSAGRHIRNAALS